ncbi:MAG: hypothetical protein KDJ88_18715 [Bauldia sp.]|nr:hypothetical protein [Bauldia sp.]
MAGDGDRPAERLLRRLATRGAAPAEAEEPLVGELIARDLLRRQGDRVVLTDVGKAFLRRRLAMADGFGEQHRTLEAGLVEDGPSGRQSVVRNVDESPLSRLRRTSGRDGRPYIDEAEFAAGERLRSDFTRAQLMPRVTANWSSAIAGGRRDAGGMADIADSAIAARQRIERAFDAIGPDFAGVLTDFCCFLKGIEDIERERRWPARSAKLVLRLGLASLARHYGLSPGARGAHRAGRLRHWGAADYRPAIDPGDGGS